MITLKMIVILCFNVVDYFSIPSKYGTFILSNKVTSELMCVIWLFVT